MYTASCLCGKVQMNIHQDISSVYVCHCQQCQKAQGSAFVAIVPIEKKNLNIVGGKDVLTEYLSTPNKKRVFCRECGSPLFSERLDLPEIVRLRVGIINESLQAKLYSHAYVKYKASWFEIPQDDALLFEEQVTERPQS